MKHVVVVGSSVAGIRAVETLRRRGYDGRLTLVGAEAELPYNRPPLSKELLTGELDEGDVRLTSEEQLAALGVELQLGAPATSLDLAARTVRAGKRAIRYDGLIIATGSRPVRPAGWPSLPGLQTLRTLGDALALRQAMTAGGPRVVVIGAGFIGCEIASAARHHGCDTTVVEAEVAPLRRALSPALAEPVVRRHRDHGVRLRLGVAVTRVFGSTRVEGVELTDGSVLDADLVVVGVGAVPVTDWLEDSGLALADGVSTDATLRTAAPGVYAAGDVARWPGTGAHGSVRVEHWTNAREQGARAAANLLDPGSAQPYTSVPYVWSDQHGRRLQIAGSATTGEPRFLAGGPDQGSYLAVLIEGGLVVAAVGFDRTQEFARVRRLVGTGAPWSQVVAQLSSVA